MTSGKKDTTFESEVRAEVEFLANLVGELQVSVATSFATITEGNKATVNMAAEMMQAMVTLSNRFKENNESLAKLLTAIELVIKRVDTLEKSNALLYKKDKALS